VGKVILCCPTYNDLFSCLIEEYSIWIIVFLYSMSVKNIGCQRSVVVKVRKPSLNGTITIRCKQDRIYTNFNETIQLKTCEKQHITAIIKMHQVSRTSVLFIITPLEIACMIISNSIIDVLPYIIYVGFILH
jgi:hypothetical protein